MNRLQIITWCLLLYILTGCNKDAIAPPNIIPAPILMDEVFFDIPSIGFINAHVFISNLDGELLGCYDVSGGDTLLELTAPVIQQTPLFNLTLQIAYADDYSIDGQTPTRVHLETYTHLKTNRIRTKRITYTANPGFNPFGPYVTVDPNMSSNLIEFFSAGSTTHNIHRFYGDPARIGIPEEGSDVFVLLKRKNDNQWRFQLFENVVHNDYFQLDFSTMTILDNHIIDIPEGMTLSTGGIYGIASCEPYRGFLLQRYTGYEENKIATAFPTDDFDRFYSYIHLRSETGRFQFNQFGEPLMAYTPSPIEFSVNQHNLEGFWLTPEAGASYYQAHWNTIPPGTNASEILQSAYWTVLGTLQTPFAAPPLPECITSAFPWINLNDMRLKMVTQCENSTLTDYEAIARFELSPKDYAFNCNNLGLNGMGQQEKKTRVFE